MRRKPETGIQLLPIDLDISKYRTFIEDLSEDAWNSWVERQAMANWAGKHRNTHSIKVQWVPINLSDAKLEYIDRNEFYYNETISLLGDVFSQLEKMYDGIVYRIVVVRLQANSFVEQHRDTGYSFEKHHRFHIPLVTNTDCIFKCGLDEMHMEEGSIYEINNQLTHSVVNNGPARIHMIIDIAPKDTITYDRNQ
jgi:hypothetical protein